MSKTTTNIQGELINAPVNVNSSPQSSDTQPTSTPADSFEKMDGYSRIPFEFLTNFTINEPDWSKMDSKEYVTSINLDAQIPDRISTYDGRKVEIQGFMLPIDYEKGKVKSFFLLKDQMMCCFGVIPRINDWVYVKVASGMDVVDTPDVPVTITGVFHVGQEFEDGIILGVYHMTLDALRKEM